MDASALFHDHIQRFNRSVAQGDFEEMVDGFATDAEMCFVGVPVGPFLGREAIREAYRNQPPTDQLVVLAIEDSRPECYTATYAWKTEPDQTTGRIRCAFRDGLIRRMEVSFESD